VAHDSAAKTKKSGASLKLDLMLIGYNRSRRPAMGKGETNPRKLNVWGESMMNKLPGISRKRRKRSASKKRRALLRRESL